MAIYTATTPAQADTFIPKMAPGDTLKLSGQFNQWRPGGRVFGVATTFDCSAATLSDIYTGGWGGVVWLGGQWKVGKTYMTGLRDEGSANCQYVNMVVDGAQGGMSGYDTAIWLNGGSNALIKNPTIANAQNGIWTFDINGLQILAGTITGTGSDAIQFADCAILIDGIAINGLNPVTGDHPDMIQGRSTAGKPRRDVTIQNVKGKGNGQGIFVTPDNGGTGFGTVTIKNNVIAAGFVRGITVDSALKSVVTGNDVSTLPSSPFQAAIQCPASDGTNVRSGNIVRGATLVDGSVMPAITDADYVAPAPLPSPAPAPTAKPKPRTMNASITGPDGANYTGTLTEKLS